MPSDLILLEEIFQEIRALRQDAERDRKFQHEVLEQLKKSNATLDKILAAESGPDLNDSIILTIPNQNGGNIMGNPASLTVAGGPVQCTAVESLNGVPSTTFNGPLAFASDNTSVATIDPASGLLTPVAAGTANISVVDAVGNLTDSDVLTVIAGVTPPTQNDSISLTIPAQAAAGRRRF
jgi:Bacterial Ig-like domain (group 2)